MIRRGIKLAAIATLVLIIAYIASAAIRAIFLKRQHDRLAPCEETDTCLEGPFVDDMYIPRNAEISCSAVNEVVLEGFSTLKFRAEEAPCTPDVVCSQATGLMREKGACVPDTPCSQASEDLFQLGACQLEPCSTLPETYLRKERIVDIKFPLCKPDAPCTQVKGILLDPHFCTRGTCTDVPGELRDTFWTKQLCFNHSLQGKQLLPFCGQGDTKSDYLSGECLRQYACAESLGVKWQTAADLDSIEVHPPADWFWDLCYPDAPCSKLPKVFADHGACIPDAATGTAS